MLKKKIIIILEDKKSLIQGLIDSYIRLIRDSFGSKYEIVPIFSKNELENIKNVKVLVILGLVPQWFKKSKKEFPVIHFVADKYMNEFFLDRPHQRFNKFFIRGNLKAIYNNSFMPDIILVHNNIMKNDFEDALKFFQPKIYVIPYFTDHFNNKLKKKITYEEKRTSAILYNSTNLISKNLYSRVIDLKAKNKLTRKYILNISYDNKSQNSFFDFNIIAILNYRFTTWDYINNLNKNFFNVCLYYVFYNLYYLFFSFKNIKVKKENVLFSIFLILKSYFLKNNLIDNRWKPATKLQLAAGLGIPLISCYEKSITENNLNQYPIFFYKNIRDLDNIYKNQDWISLLEVCKYKGQELLIIYRVEFYKLMFKILNEL